jgi:hypothetical protein
LLILPERNPRSSCDHWDMISSFSVVEFGLLRGIPKRRSRSGTTGRRGLDPQVNRSSVMTPSSGHWIGLDGLDGLNGLDVLFVCFKKVNSKWTNVMQMEERSDFRFRKT